MSSQAHISPFRSSDSGYDSTNSYDDNPVIWEVVFDLKNDCDEKDGISGNRVLRKNVNARINRHLGK